MTERGHTKKKKEEWRRLISIGIDMEKIVKWYFCYQCWILARLTRNEQRERAGEEEEEEERRWGSQSGTMRMSSSTHEKVDQWKYYPVRDGYRDQESIFHS